MRVLCRSFVYGYAFCLVNFGGRGGERGWGSPLNLPQNQHLIEGEKEPDSEANQSGDGLDDIRDWESDWENQIERGCNSGCNFK